MTNLNSNLISLAIGVIASLAAPPIKNQFERNERVIQALKKLKLNPDHPPADFTGVYRYALVQYGIDKPQPLLQLLRQEGIIRAFRQAFEQNNQSPVLIEVAKISWIFNLNTLGIDLQEELNQFKDIFIEVANSTRTPADVIQSQEIKNLSETLETIANTLAAPTLWSYYVTHFGEKERVSFKLKDRSELRVAEPDDTERKEIRLGQGFRLVYQLPFAGYALLMQGLNSSWVVTRLGKCTDETLNQKTRYIQERIAKVLPSIWSVPTNKTYLKEKDYKYIGLNRFVLLISKNVFPEVIQEMVYRETQELSLSALSTLVKYVQENIDNSRIKLIVAECNIVP